MTKRAARIRCSASSTKCVSNAPSTCPRVSPCTRGVEDQCTSARRTRCTLREGHSLCDSSCAPSYRRAHRRRLLAPTPSLTPPLRTFPVPPILNGQTKTTNACDHSSNSATILYSADSGDSHHRLAVMSDSQTAKLAILFFFDTKPTPPIFSIKQFPLSRTSSPLLVYPCLDNLNDQGKNGTLIQ